MRRIERSGSGNSALLSRASAKVFERGWYRDATMVDAALRQMLRAHAGPKRLKRALAYALFGGMRFRGSLLLESAALFGVSKKAAVRTAAALECVHCYSLAHDDLPAMDNDAWRRGKPAVHRQFTEATAILAGDALLTLAFEILADAKTHSSPAVRTKLALRLARAAGMSGMVGGQMLDVESGMLSKQRLFEMHANKTGALIRFSCEAGALIGGARQSERRLAAFGMHLGALYQLADDLDDREKDSVMERPNAAETLGTDALLLLIAEHTKAAVALLQPFGARAEMLRGFLSRVTEGSSQERARASTPREQRASRKKRRAPTSSRRAL